MNTEKNGDTVKVQKTSEKLRITGKEAAKIIVAMIGFLLLFLAVSLLVRSWDKVGVSFKSYATSDVTYASGETYHSDSSYFGSVSRGDTVTVHVALPKDQKIERAALCFAIYHSVTEVYWNNTLLDAYGEDIDARGDMVGNHRFTVSIPDEAWGDEITIILHPTENSAFARINTLNVYAEKEVFQYTWDINPLGFWTSVPMLLIGIVMLLLMPCVKGSIRIEGICISTFIVLLSLYIITTDLLPLLGFTGYFWTQLEFILVYIISFPLMTMAVYGGKAKWFRTVTACVLGLDLLFFALATVLNFTNILHYAALLRFSHILSGINCFLLLWYSIGKAMDGSRSGGAYFTGFIAVISVGLFELVRTNIPAMVKAQIPSILHVGMLFFTIMLVLSYIISFSEAQENLHRSAELLMRQNDSLLKKEEEMRAMKSELEQNHIKVLLSQIQPHFLYNALSSIRVITKTDPDRAYDLLYDFTVYLRSNIKALSSDNPIPFADEIKNARAYLNIEQMRMGDRLKVEYRLECVDFDVIPLTVQPIAENAVKHGIFERGKDGGTVVIRSRETGDAYVVEVQDDGVGFDVDKALRDGDNSFGIRNLTYRLYSLMNASVAFQSELGKGTLVTVTIPKNGGDSDENDIC